MTQDEFPPRGTATIHALPLGGDTVAYRALADWLDVGQGHAPAHLFHVAYLAETSTGADRPLTFVFNGGPGAASAYLHMGAMGPRRVLVGKAGSLPSPPVRVTDNGETWLRFTDIVFVDPVGTGFSRSFKDAAKVGETPPPKAGRPASPEAREYPDYWEVERDIQSLCDFIARFLSRHQRWTSPLYIAGESYGGFRVARLTRKLQESHGVSLCGAILISPVLEYDAQIGSDYHLTHCLDLFPSLAAAAHHHGRTRNVPANPAEVRALAEEFACSTLVALLLRGDALAGDARAAILQRASDLIGLSAAMLDRAGGRITASTFCRELLRDERKLCGRLDASVTATDPFPDRNAYEGPDPTVFSVNRLFAAAINQHLRVALEVNTTLDYRLFNKDAYRAWRQDAHILRQPAGAVDELRYGMSLNEHIRVWMAHGFLDLVTPYFGSRRLVDLMKLTPAQRTKLMVRNFDGGHMFYLWDESRLAFAAEGEKFYNTAPLSP